MQYPFFGLGIQIAYFSSRETRKAMRRLAREEYYALDW